MDNGLGFAYSIARAVATEVQIQAVPGQVQGNQVGQTNSFDHSQAYDDRCLPGI